MDKHKSKIKSVKNMLSKLKNTGKTNVAKNKFLQLTDMPIYLNEENTRISVFNNTNLYIEQYLNIVDYFNHYIKVRCTKYDLLIEGKNLVIDEINKEDLVINGDIDSICYKRR